MYNLGLNLLRLMLEYRVVFCVFFTYRRLLFEFEYPFILRVSLRDGAMSH